MATPIKQKPMTKTLLTKTLAEKLKITKIEAMSFLDMLGEIAIRETKRAGVFVLPGIGRLVRVHRNARMGRNPRTGEAIQIKAKNVVKFRVAKVAKDAIVPSKAA
jgi:DNA-binding protein HU-beta